MKFAALSAVLLCAVVRAQPQKQSDIPGGKIAQCFFANTFETGDSLATSGVANFKVVQGAEVRCFSGCLDGGEFTTAYKLGSATGGANTAGTTEKNEFCESTTKFTADADYVKLGWSISTKEKYSFLAITCFCTDDGSDITLDAGQDVIDDVQNELGCFSESATVQVHGRGEIAMKELQLGDKVLTGKGTYEPVYTFGHRKPDFQMEFYQIHFDGATAALEMTGNHMVMVMDGKGHTHATRADHLQIGNLLLHIESQQTVTVTDIQKTQKMGLYMPLTPSGEIVVNGVLASNYISISDTAPGVVEHSQMFFPMNEQTLSHWWMSPVRMLCMGVSSSLCSNGFEGSSTYEMEEEDNGILPWLLMGRHLAHVAEDQPTLVRFVMGVPTFLFFGTLNAVEHLFFGPTSAPFLVLATLTLVAIAKRRMAQGTSEFERSAGYNLLSSSAV